VEQLGGPPEPGIGFAIGVERVVLLLGNAVPPAQPAALLIPLGEAALRRLLPIAQSARARGVGVELGYGTRKLRAELERAHKLGVTYAVIVGDDELGRDEAMLRDMKTGTQKPVALAALPALLLDLSRGVVDLGQDAPR
jgi:histidyl-tRNA synthetase